MATGLPLKATGDTLTAAEFNTLRQATDLADDARHTHANQAALDATEQPYTTAEQTKLSGVEAGATADQTGAEIKAAYEAEADTNAFTDADKATLSNYAGKNLIINGDFSVWQRGTSQTNSGYGSDDRWANFNVGSTKTHSQQSFTLGQTDVPNNPKHFSRTVVTSAAGSSNFALKFHRIEDVATGSGQTVTLSFWAKADSAKSIATEFSQEFGTGGSPSTKVSSIGVATHSLTTSWQKFTVTTTLPSISGKTLGSDGNSSLEVNLWFDAGTTYAPRTNSLGQQSGTFDISNVQLELGSVPTGFERVDPADQLARCQRYYRNLVSHTAGGSHPTSVGPVSCWDSNNAYTALDTSGMRTTPILKLSNPTHFDVYEAGLNHTCSLVDMPLSSKSTVELRFESIGAFAVGNSGWVRANTTNAEMALDAEL